jgi:hypothetical protein
MVLAFKQLPGVEDKEDLLSMALSNWPNFYLTGH